MEELIEKIISIIKQREESMLILSCRSPFDDDQGISGFLYNKYICLKEVDVLFLERFIKKDSSDPLVKWLYRSYDFDCCLSFELSFSNIDLIPQKVFNECSVTLINDQGKQYCSFSNKVVTYKQVALLTEKHILVVASDQLVTALAKERLQEKRVVVVERRSTLC